MVNPAEDSPGSAADADSTHASTLGSANASAGFMEFLECLMEHQRSVIADSQNIKMPAAVDRNSSARAPVVAEDESVSVAFGAAETDWVKREIQVADADWARRERDAAMSAAGVRFHVDNAGVQSSNASWERMMKRERKKTALLQYDGSAMYKIIFKFRYTILDYILKDPLFYFTLLVYVLVRVGDSLWERATGSVLNGETWFPKGGSFGVVGGFMNFVLAFFVNQAIGGYQGAYGRCMASKGKITEFAQKGGACLPKERVTRIVRHLNAAHLVGYAGLTHGQYEDDFIMPLNDEMNLLTNREIAKLNNLKNPGGPRYCFQICMWIMKDLKQAFDMNEFDNFAMSEWMNFIQGFRKSMSAHFNAANVPAVSFFYFHFISLLCVVYLPMFAAQQALACSDPPTIDSGFYPSDIVQLFVVIIQSLFVIGMRFLAVKLSNPYGEDAEDLPLITFVRAAWRSSEQTLRVAEDEEQLMADPVAWNKKDRPTQLRYPVENKIG